MKIIVGSVNPNKVEAVRELIAEYPIFAEAEVTGADVSSGVSEQPMGYEEMMRGAANRARNARGTGGDVGVGIEAGLVLIGEDLYNIQACCVTDGSMEYFGFSSGFLTPKGVKQYIDQGDQLDYALKKAGITDHPRIGYGGGIIAVLTNERLDRKGLVKEALRMALIPFEQKQWY